ncbi:SRPBCC family protein [Sulfitobacter sp. F26169L]|uniref:SRPBCC family protein n=1 Tax=Sulfitobacter sp. F26169L TaxID=2996015 RepID=UPI002260ADC0|nr:SRPBCC family protein [Sulfitobacter sp. F26169L]MCX7566698.1 SRPBCC family protein [Sulfitobacter sp. F26169L]
MKFSTKEDIEAPIDAVFEMLCDFETFERAAMRRGSEVQRIDTMTTPGVGMGWRAAFNMRGKRRQVEIEVITFERPEEMVLECRSQGLLTLMTVELVALSKSRTRIMLSFDIKPLNLSARLLVQSLKLAKTSLTKKYKLRVANFAKSLEERYSRA